MKSLSKILLVPLMVFALLGTAQTRPLEDYVLDYLSKPGVANTLSYPDEEEPVASVIITRENHLYLDGRVEVTNRVYTSLNGIERDSELTRVIPPQKPEEEPLF